MEYKGFSPSDGLAPEWWNGIHGKLVKGSHGRVRLHWIRKWEAGTINKTRRIHGTFTRIDRWWRLRVKEGQSHTRTDRRILGDSRYFRRIRFAQISGTDNALDLLGILE